MSIARHHAEWLSLVETSGPFLSMPVLLRVFPQGLDSRDAQQAARLREAYEDWLEHGAKQPSVHHAWIRHVLQELLAYPEGWLAEGQAIPPGIQAVMANVGEVLRPDILLKRADGDEKYILLVALYPPEQDLEKPIRSKLWKATAGTRMMELLHAADLPLGLITNGEEWTLVSAPRGETTGFASWYADLWMQEPLTLRAFHSLLHLRRLVGVAEPDTLPALFAGSSKDQQEVTDQLGYQVRQAVEVLVQAFDRIDAESGRTLLSGISEKALYDSALTVMMRLVFLFSAEERGLLLLGDPLYDQNYALSTLSALLREQADQHGEEVLERRHDAWCRLLSTFRAVHGGVEHEAMRLPAYGGTLFDPDRYPFLEGRKGGTSWRNSPATPLLINNRVVLHLLEALQVLRVKVPGGGPAQARRLSFRALDIVQIGHVYEGLLDHTAKRAVEPILGLAGSKDKEPEIPLVTLEEIAQKGTVALVEFLRDETGRSERALKRLIEEPPPSDDHALLIACGQDERLVRRVRSFAPLLREDSFGHLVVVPPGSVYVTAGSDRRSTGTHYTPRSLTEPIVKYTLEPQVYIGPADGLPEAEWTLRTPKEILALNVCDMAMGSGAFLVETCRYLAERLVEAWENAEREHPGSFISTPEGELSTGAPSERLLPLDSAERLAIARRYVADRCLYGVDINPMAVEMAKLSLWLSTSQRDRPFTFFDHAFKCGDSLLGVTALKQLEVFSLRPGARQATFATALISQRLEEASAKRRLLEDLPSHDYIQIKSNNRLHAEAEEHTATAKAVGDLLVAFEMRDLEGESYDQYHAAAAAEAEAAMRDTSTELQRNVAEALKDRRTFHWALEFPEVFARSGFDAVVGNPPFLGGVRISELHGDDYNEFLALTNPPYSRRVDLCAYFLRRAAVIANAASCVGLLATNTISQGTTRRGGLDAITGDGATIVYARKSFPWPGNAAVVAALVIFRRGSWNGSYVCDDQPCAGINTLLEAATPHDSVPHRLVSNSSRSFQGSGIWGEGFFISDEHAKRMISSDPRNALVVKQAIGGEEFNNSPEIQPSRWIVDMGEMGEMEASSFELPFRYLHEEVRPWRESKDPVKYSRIVRSWWKYFHSRSDLYDGIRLFSLSRVLARARVSDRHMVAFLPTGIVYTEQLAVFLLDKWWHFAVIQSSVHDLWARTYASTLKTDVRYVPPDCFYTFPFPFDFDLNNEALDRLGQDYYAFRSSLMLQNRLGLTSLYNRFHDPTERSEQFATLRRLHAEMDAAVAMAYGWDPNELDFAHGFHDTRQGMRYKISEAARRTVVDRLLALNQRRYAEERNAGQTGQGTGKPKRRMAASVRQADLLG